MKADLSPVGRHLAGKPAFLILMLFCGSTFVLSESAPEEPLPMPLQLAEPVPLPEPAAPPLPEPTVRPSADAETDGTTENGSATASGDPSATIVDPGSGGLHEPHVQPALQHELEGYASWYGGKFQGRLTANGEVFDTNQFTAAHKTLPFGTIVEVTHLGNSKTVEVRINDRGPFVEGRVIDLSRAAADALGMSGEGVARVRLRIVSEPGEPVRSIQVAAFSEAASASTVVRRLEESGIPAELEPGETPDGRQITRVVVPNVVESQVPVVVAQLAEAGYSSVFVRTR